MASGSGVAQVDRLGSTDCERIRDGWIAQPVNTATSVAFVAAAGMVAVRLRYSPHRGQVAAYAALLALVGAGSVAFHGPQPPGAKRLHDWPIAGILVIAVATPVMRRVRGRTPAAGWSRGRGLALAGIGAASALSYAAGRTDAPTCRPDSVLQGHGAWHVLAAAGLTVVAETLYGEPAAR